MISDARALAALLAARDDSALAETLAARGVPPSASWQDFFDAADALLDAASLDRALARLDRATLMALAEGAPSSEGPASTFALLDQEGRPFAAVSERVAAAAAAHPEAFTPAQAQHPAVAADSQTAAAAAERAFSTCGSLAEVLLTCLHAPLTRTGAGSVSAADRKRLLEDGAVSAPEDVEDLLASASAAGLAAAGEREWLVTEAGRQWLRMPTPQRWTVIADGFRASLPRGIRTPDGGFVAPSSWSDAYPLDPAWPDVAARLRRMGARWGLFEDEGIELAWTAALRRGEPADATAMAAHLPAEIDRVYLQADLTAIAPGPLAPALDLRLRGVARRESRAQASTYRFTAASLGAGMTEGETAASIRSFLSTLSLTGIPQPLEYLIESTASRHGRVRVGLDPASGRTRVESEDAGLLETIAVDQALRPLGLVRGEDGLLSRVPRDAVYWALADARYPVVALDDTGQPMSMHRRAGGSSGESARTPLETYAKLLAALRGGEARGAHTEDAWLGRELEQAVRARAQIAVVVRMPDGTERSLVLEASGLGGGRLRGRDRAADIERTLPVSSIVSVRPL